MVLHTTGNNQLKVVKKLDTGRILTTMKAGDFFGEIGILNLDGLNKRTADVRSVGYSELFSLSREDVLTAMKDYPEAQEILQTLGRKRLMEARNMNRAWKMSAMQKKEKNQIQIPKPETELDPANKSIVEKIRGDVKELRNVFKKSSRTARGKSEIIELEMSKRQTDKEAQNKGTFARQIGGLNCETSIEDDSQASQKIGAGLPLLQRLKLLKEKQELEKKNTSESVSSTSIDKKDSDPGLPLLQRILLLKQKDDRKTDVVQTTANMTAELLASTVRTQLKSPTTQLTLKPNLKHEDGQEMRLSEKRNSGAEFHKKIFSKKLRNRSLDLDASITSSVKEAPKQAKEKKTQIEGDNESWDLIKKAVLVPNSSLDIQEKKQIETRKNDIAFNESQSLGTIKGQILSTINSITDSSAENSMAQKYKASTSVDKPQRYCTQDDSHLNHKPKYKEDRSMTRSDDEQNRVPPVRRNPTRIVKKQKFYNSIDDLSPEYSGLPFVKKLKILNERQKLAELEKNVPSKLGLKYNENIIEHADHHTKTCQKEVRDAGIETCEEISSYIYIGKNSTVECKVDKDDEDPMLQETATKGTADTTDLPLLSPESNETLERRQLKSILKKLSHVSPVQLATDTNEKNSNSAVKGGIADIRKLLRAPTFEGYAARHSKFTKSITLNRNSMELGPTSTENASLPESFTTDDECEINTHNTWSSSTARTRYSNWSESSKSVDNSQLTEISTFDNSTPGFNQAEKSPLIKCRSAEEINVKTQESVNGVETLDDFPSDFDGDPNKNKGEQYINVTPRRDLHEDLCNLNYLPGEFVSTLIQEIKNAIDDHMMKIEYNYNTKYARLEYECQVKNETISKLQKQIEGYQKENNTMVTIHSKEECHFDLQSRSIAQLKGKIDDIADHEDEVKEPKETIQEDSTILTIDESSDPEVEEVFYSNTNDWEIHLLAEELEKREEASRKRAVSFELALLNAKAHSLDENQQHRLERRNRWSAPGYLSTLTRRSVSTTNIQEKHLQKAERSITQNRSYNGKVSQITTKRLKKPASFSTGFS